MSSLLYRLGRTAALRPWRAIGIWVAIGIVLGALAVGLGGKLSTEFSIPGTQSQKGLDILDTRFPEMAGTGGQIIFTTTDGSKVDDHKDVIAATMKKASKVDGVNAAPDPLDKDTPGTVSHDRTAVIGNIQMEGQVGNFPKGSLDRLASIARSADGDGLKGQIGGQILQDNSMPLGISEVIGVVAALIILAITFRAIVPAVIPIFSAIVGIVIAMLLMLVGASALEISEVTPSLAVMLGLAVGIDYSLFILSRHRHQLSRGMDVVESIGEAIATSGSAVIFAGTTVVIALVGLFITGIPFLTLMGLVSAGAVVCAVLVALSLLPAILGLAGELIRPRKVRRAMAANGGKLPEDPADEGKEPKNELSGFYGLWVRAATKLPALTVILVLAVLGAVAIPAKDMRLGLPDLGTYRTDTQARQSYDLVSEKFGPGFNGPLLVTADIINTTDPVGTMDDLKAQIEKLPDVREIQLATPNRTGDMGVVVVIPDGAQTDESTATLVKRLRSDSSSWEKKYGISDVMVTGQTAVTVDITQKLSDALLPFGIFVVGLSLILLMVVFRSIWVPIKASLGYVLSLGAAFGAIGMVFEYGWGNDALNIHMTGPVISFMPIMVMGVLFGLAMDYEVFLVSRMREEYIRTGDARWSIQRGFVASAPVVVAAALIMIAVFSSFIPEATYMIQPIAVALTVGVLADAFLVRMTLVPAVMALLGKSVWWLPRRLAKILPHVDVEGEGLEKVLENKRWIDEHGTAALRLDGAETPRIGPITGVLRAGEALLVLGEDPRDVADLLALASGRLSPVGGIVAEGERVSPEDIDSIRSHAMLIPAGVEASSRLEALDLDRCEGILIVIDRADSLLSEDAPALLVERLEHGAAAVIGCAGTAGELAADRLRSEISSDIPLPVIELGGGADAHQSAPSHLAGGTDDRGADARADREGVAS